MTETSTGTTVDVRDLSKIGLSSEAQKRVSTALQHLADVIGREIEKAPRKEAVKVDLGLKATYSEKGGAGGEVSVTVHFG